MVEGGADDLFRNVLQILEINHHITRASLGLGDGNVHPIGVPMQVLAQSAMIGQNVRRIELDRLCYCNHGPIIPHTPAPRENLPPSRRKNQATAQSADL